jgi:hypothetical protein
MYIVVGDKNIQELKKKYIVLELDTINVSAINTTTYCVVNSPVINAEDISALELHANLIKNYKIGNWKFCNDAIKHLQGKFDGELDTFYDIFKERVKLLQKAKPPTNWTGVIDSE